MTNALDNPPPPNHNWIQVQQSQSPQLTLDTICLYGGTSPLLPLYLSLIQTDHKVS